MIWMMEFIIAKRITRVLSFIHKFTVSSFAFPFFLMISVLFESNFSLSLINMGLVVNHELIGIEILNICLKCMIRFQRVSWLSFLQNSQQYNNQVTFFLLSHLMAQRLELVTFRDSYQKLLFLKLQGYLRVLKDGLRTRG